VRAEIARMTSRARSIMSPPRYARMVQYIHIYVYRAHGSTHSYSKHTLTRLDCVHPCARMSATALHGGRAAHAGSPVACGIEHGDGHTQALGDVVDANGDGQACAHHRVRQRAHNCRARCVMASKSSGSGGSGGSQFVRA
jgi:hypothetical protein